MLSRRIIRVKTMQVLYSNEISKDISSTQLEKNVRKHIKDTELLYHTYLLYLVEICNYSLVYAAKQEKKLLKDDSDTKFSTALAQNTVIQSIQNSKDFKDYISFNKVHDYINPKLVKSIFDIVCKKEKYQSYISQDQRSKRDDIDMLRNIIKKSIGASFELEEDLAEHFINIEDDSYYALLSIQKTLKSFENVDESVFLQRILLLEDNSEIQLFAINLLKKYIEHESELVSIIKPNLKNWDMERVAAIDQVIIKMAICELKYFPSIPVKVSINEYVDIAKEYSTDKSKDFINGILDKIMKLLKEDGKIRKQGRGLIN